jgi:hypothetical protein
MEWTLLQAIYRARGAAQMKLHGTPPRQTIQDEFGFPAMLVGQWVYTLDNYNHQTLSSGHYMQRNTYHHPARLDGLFQEMADSGVLEPTGEQVPVNPVCAEDYGATCPQYRTTDKGYRLYHRIDELLRPRWSLPIDGVDIDGILALIDRVAQATRSAPTPPAHWAVDTRAQCGMKLEGELPPLQQLDRYTFDLWAYRDDTHLAAWRDVYPDLKPRAWEAFSVIWRGDAADAESLAKALQDHGFSAAHYETSLQDLTRRGWLEAVDGKYHVTDVGKQVRQAAEDRTDTYFYKPWDEALGSERAELRALLESLRDKIVALGS